MSTERAIRKDSVMKKNSVYTHPEKWKDVNVFRFLDSIEPDLRIRPDSFICRNCRDCLASGKKDPENFSPRWKKEFKQTVYVMYQAVQSQHLRAQNWLISMLLGCALKSRLYCTLCHRHYRSLHKELNPIHYQWKCTVCSIPHF